MTLRKMLPIGSLALILMVAALGPAMAEETQEAEDAQEVQEAEEAEEQGFETDFYIGLGLGESRFRHDRDEVVDGFAFDAFNVTGFTSNGRNFESSDSDMPFSVLVGYKFTPNIAVEAGYAYLGVHNYGSDGTAMNGNAPYGINAELSAAVEGLFVSAVGGWPLSRWFELFARAGVFYANVDLSATVSDFSMEHSFETSSQSVEPMLSVGAAWNMSEGFTVRADYTRFFEVGKRSKTGEADIDTIMVSAIYSIYL